MFAAFASLGVSLAATAVAPQAPAGAAGAQSVERQLAAMGTRLRGVVTASDRAVAWRAREAAVAAGESAGARLSTWRNDTELGRVNKRTSSEALALRAGT